MLYKYAIQHQIKFAYCLIVGINVKKKSLYDLYALCPDCVCHCLQVCGSFPNLQWMKDEQVHHTVHTGYEMKPLISYRVNSQSKYISILVKCILAVDRNLKSDLPFLFDVSDD